MLVLGAFASATWAQNPTMTNTAPSVKQQDARPAHPPKHKTPDEWVSEVDAVVGLTADQKTKAKALAEDTEAKMKALRAEAEKNREEAKQKRMQILKERKEKLNQMLDDAQRAKWKSHQDAQMAKMAANKERMHKTPDEAVADLDKIVTLTADQKTKVKTLAETRETKMKALREEQKSNPDETVFKEKRKQIGMEYRAELNKILTPEQKAKLKAAMEQKKAEQPSGAPNR